MLKGTLNKKENVIIEEKVYFLSLKVGSEKMPIKLALNMNSKEFWIPGSDCYSCQSRSYFDSKSFKEDKQARD
jgi:hypothetical protein